MDTKTGDKLPENAALSAELVAELVSGLGAVIRETGIYTPLGIGLLENQTTVLVLARAGDDPRAVEAFCQTFTDEGKTVQTFFIDAQEGEVAP